jgi:hypothetical protein
MVPKVMRLLRRPFDPQTVHTRLSEQEKPWHKFIALGLGLALAAWQLLQAWEAVHR